MKFIPRRPREGINVSDTHPLAEAGLLIAALTAIFVGIALVLIFLVEIVLRFVSPETEAQLFSSWTPDDVIAVEADDDRIHDTAALLDRLVAHWPDTPYSYRIEVSQSDVPNALAFPGGLIVVTSALLDRVETENELAFVLGHELGHFRNRDHIRALGRGVLLGIVFGAVLGGDGGANFGLTVADLTALRFSREQETDADEFGLSLLYADYGHVGESWRFFERLVEDGKEPSGLATYLSTHPATDERIAEIREYAEARGWPIEGPATSLSW